MRAGAGIVDSPRAVGNTLLAIRRPSALMPPNKPAPDFQNRPTHPHASSAGVIWGVAILVTAILAWFYYLQPRYGGNRDTSALLWLTSAWNGETDYQHGWMFPILIAGLVIYRLKDLRAAVTNGRMWGLGVVFLGVLFYIAGYRTLQPRVTVGALPIMVWGSVVYLWGWQVGKILAFPIFFFWLAIPLPSFQQATTHLQLLATSLAHHGSGLFGVETYVEGTKVLPIKGNWEPLDIAKGCSGIRSLMALLMISAAWAYIAKIKLWQKVFLFLCAFPLAILGNSLRVISIFVIAEYGNAKWATTTWHDWSGLLLFFPFSLMLLLVIHSLFEGGLPWQREKKRQVRRVVTRGAEERKPVLSES